MFWQGKAVNIGAVAAGESSDLTIERPSLADEDRWEPLVAKAWPTAIPPWQGWWVPDGPATYDPETPVAVPLWDEYAATQPMLSSSENVVIAGWSEQITSPLASDTVGTALVTNLVAVINPSVGAVDVISLEPVGSCRPTQTPPTQTIVRFGRRGCCIAQ